MLEQQHAPPQRSPQITGTQPPAGPSIVPHHYSNTASPTTRCSRTRSRTLGPNGSPNRMHEHHGAVVGWQA